MDRDTTGTSKVTKKNQAANISSSRVALSEEEESEAHGKKKNHNWAKLQQNRKECIDMDGIYKKKKN